MHPMAEAAPDELIEAGIAHQLAGRLAEAEQTYRRVLVIFPRHAEALHLLGLVAHEKGEDDVAIDLVEEAIAVAPNRAEYWNDCGELYRSFLMFDQAERCYRQAIGLAPEDAKAWSNLGLVYQARGLVDESLEYLRRACDIDPGFAVAHVNMAVSLLLRGDFAGAWEQYSHRSLRLPEYLRGSSTPRWDGAPLEGRTILVVGEQGLGDQIWFASCLPDLLDVAARVVVDPHPRLVGLFAASFPGAEIMAAGGPCPSVDCYVPMGDLPRHFRCCRKDFPGRRSYLVADVLRRARWRQALDALGPGLKVGISWRGGLVRTGRQQRSLDLEAFVPLLKLSGCHFVSLQYGPHHSEIGALRDRHGIAVHHWHDAIDEYDETAALVAELDLVVSVDTSVVHLAGALGTAVWVLLPFAPEGRWQLGCTDSPWYPAVRLFRQQAVADWLPVLAEVRKALIEQIDRNWAQGGRAAGMAGMARRLYSLCRQWL